MTKIKIDIEKAAAKKSGMKMADVCKAMDAILESIGEALMNGDEVMIKNLGSFKVKDHRLVNGMDGKTYELKKVSFKGSKTFRNRLNGKEAE